MLDKLSLKPILESLIFAADSAISFDRLAGALEGEERPVIKEALHELIEDYRAKAGGFLLEEVAGGFQFRTNPEFSPWLRKFFKIGMQKISKAAMESLAVIAYKQPVTRGEIEAVRGVDSGGVLATLMEKRFIKIVGRKEVPGRPVVYGTTKEFLETFDLKDLSCLPTLKDLQKMEEEYAQTEGQGTAEAAVEDRVQGAEETGGRIETEVQEPVRGRQAGSAEGEETEAGAEDDHGADWEETDPEEVGAGRTEKDFEPAGAGAGQKGPADFETGLGDPESPDLEERDREGDPDSESGETGTGETGETQEEPDADRAGEEKRRGEGGPGPETEGEV